MIEFKFSTNEYFKIKMISGYERTNSEFPLKKKKILNNKHKFVHILLN